MLDQLRIGNKYSYDDFDASVAFRRIGEPKKKVIKETVPYSNTTYDFSAINGEVYWDERELEYTLEIDADTPEELEELKRALKNWVMNVMNEDLYDPFIEDYHFKATFADISFDDSEIEKTTAIVKFTAYPYMLSNKEKSFSGSIQTSRTTSITVKNSSGHRITPTIVTTSNATFDFSGASYSISTGEITDPAISLPVGDSVFSVKASSTSGTFTIKFREEVF